MGYTKLKDTNGASAGVAAAATAKKTAKKSCVSSSSSSSVADSSWKLCWNATKRQGYGAINDHTVNNTSPKGVEKTSGIQGHNTPLEQIQNALFVTQSSNLIVENESASKLLGKVSACSPAAAGPSSCQRIQCKKLLRRFKKVLKFSSDRATSEQEQEDIYVEVNQLVSSSTADILSYLKKDKTMQEMRSRFECSTGGGGAKAGAAVTRPAHLLYANAIHNQNLINNNHHLQQQQHNNSSRSSVIASQNFINNNHTNGGGNLSKSVDNCWTGSNKTAGRFCNGDVMESSEEDNSPTEMNSSRKFVDKPPLVKRLTMALLLKTSEDSRPLMCSSQTSNLNNYKTSSTKGSCQSIFGGGGGGGEAGYVNEGICDLDQIISSKFGDSCRKSLMSMTNHHEAINWSIDHLNNQEFNFKKNLLRETSSANSSPKIFSKPFRGTQHMHYSEQQELKDASWFQAGIPRDICLEVLSKQSPGAFIVRNSNSKPGCFVLSLRVSPPLPKVAHYLILRTSRGYKIKGFTKEFTSLRALITHHSVMPELLPVPLALPRPKDIPARRNANDFDTYESLSDFQKLMTDLNDNLKLSTLVL